MSSSNNNYLLEIYVAMITRIFSSYKIQLIKAKFL